MQSDIFSGSLSNVSSAEAKSDEFVSGDAVVTPEEVPMHEKAFDGLSSLRSELFSRPHLPNEEDTSIITTMIANLNEGMITLTLTHPARLILTSRNSTSCA